MVLQAVFSPIFLNQNFKDFLIWISGAIILTSFGHDELLVLFQIDLDVDPKLPDN